MIGWIVKALVGPFGPLIGAGAVIAGLFLWHTVDKNSAIKRALVGQLAKVELAAKDKELSVLKERAEVAEAANDAHEAAIATAEAEEQRIEGEIDAYDLEGGGNPLWIIPDPLFDKLRNP